MATLIDSSIFIAAERGKLDLDAALGGAETESFLLSAITASELLRGVHRAQSAAQRSRREAFVETILERIPVVPFDLLVARIHARLSAELQAQGVVIGTHDLQIAATALANGAQVVTRDERSFPRIPGLVVSVW